jgi:3-hydroxyacyl-CoA dehydrogenase/enoyl-CoA hydratase/3-hydroxybutyryl-CoA epimerase
MSATPAPTPNGSGPNWRLELDAQRIAWLCFDKHEASTNVLSGHVMLELDQRITEIAAAGATGVVLWSGKKSGFIAGADIKEFTALQTEQQAYELIRRGQQVLERLETLPCPSVAMINGFALGGGLEVALACTYRVALDDERVSLGLPEVKLGIHPGFGGTVRSIRVVGVQPAMEMMLTGRAVDAGKARRLGLVDALTSEGDWRKRCTELLAARPAPHRPPLAARVLGWPLVRGVIAGKIAAATRAKANPDHYPAPFAIIDLWRRHWGDEPAMFEAEARSIAHLMVGETARNLVRVFLLQDKLKGLGNRKALDLKRVHVIGAGVMGGDIAAVCAMRGYDVTLQDREMKYIRPALDRATALFEKRLKSPTKVAGALSRLHADVESRGVADADVIIEAIFENVDAKQALYRDLEPRMRKDALLATNTSSIKLETLRTALADPRRLIGVHFFNPVPLMPLVEVIRTDDADPAMVEKALAFCRHIDKLAVPCKSAPGFLVNRILMPYLMEAVVLHQEGQSYESIDLAATGFGMPMGPIELSDTVGLDVCLHVGKILAADFDIPVPAELAKAVDEKRLGKKSGEGFYKWVDGKPQKDRNRATGATAEVTDRLIYPMLNEAVACLREQIVADADQLDAGVIFGTGFAPFRGGPINYIRSAGPAGVARMRARMQELHARYGDRFKPDAGWAAL